MKYFDLIQYIGLLAFACLVVNRSVAEFGTERIVGNTTLKTNEPVDLGNTEPPETQKSLESSIAAAKESLAKDTQLSANNKILGRDLNNLAVRYYTAGCLSSKIDGSHEHLLEALSLLTEAQKKLGNYTTKPDQIALSISIMNESYVQRELGNKKRSDQLRQTAQSIFAEFR
jgi:hypothetical protein